MLYTDIVSPRMVIQSSHIFKASERCHVRSAINTIQAKRRLVTELSQKNI